MTQLLHQLNCIGDCLNSMGLLFARSRIPALSRQLRQLVRYVIVDDSVNLPQAI